MRLSRGKANGKELIRVISLTPFSRVELVNALTPAPSLTSLERARRFFVRARQTRTGLAQTSSEGRWAHCVLTSRAEMAGAVSRWLGSVEGLPEIVQRLQRVQIENAPAAEVVLRYDSPQTLFYCDPPYPHEARGDYEHWQAVGDRITRAFAAGQNLYIFDFFELARSVLALGGEAIRITFLKKVGEHLDTWNIQPRHRQAWQKLLQSL